MPEKRDYYEILGLSKNASDDDIKKAYRQMAKKLHPDANPGDKSAETKFKEVNEAYSVLSDKQKRDSYDRFGHAGVDPSAMGGFNASDMGGFGFDIGDIFGSFFGGGFGRSSQKGFSRRGDDIGVEITVSFEEAALGTRKEITYNRIEHCRRCGGSGAETGTKAETCATCHGTGSVRVTQRTMLGVMQSTRPCSECRGTGKVIKNPCSECKGDGVVKKKKTLEFTVPAGINNGERISLRSQGNAGENGGESGDLFVFIKVKPHNFFERKEYDLFCEVPVTFSEAALGAKISVPTLEGVSEFSIPEGTQSGATFSLRGKGVKFINSDRKGDLYVKISVEVPKNLNQKQKDALKKFCDMAGQKNYEKKQKYSALLKKQ